MAQNNIGGVYFMVPITRYEGLWVDEQVNFTKWFYIIFELKFT